MGYDTECLPAFIVTVTESLVFKALALSVCSPELKMSTQTEEMKPTQGGNNKTDVEDYSMVWLKNRGSSHPER